MLIDRRSLPESDLVDWLDRYQSPAEMEDWFDAFASVEGMQELHNSKSFIRALSDQLREQGIDQTVRARIDALVELFTSIV